MSAYRGGRPSRRSVEEVNSTGKTGTRRVTSMILKQIMGHVKTFLLPPKHLFFSPDETSIGVSSHDGTSIGVSSMGHPCASRRWDIHRCPLQSIDIVSRYSQWKNKRGLFPRI